MAFCILEGCVGCCGGESRLIGCDGSIRDDYSTTGDDATISSGATMDSS